MIYRRRHMNTIFKHSLILALVAGGFVGTASAGGTGFFSNFKSPCPTNRAQADRYNQNLPYRHYEDRRRYNAAPCCNTPVATAPYLVKTVVVKKEKIPRYYLDEKGRRKKTKTLLVTYKDIYSNGDCRVWTQEG